MVHYCYSELENKFVFLLSALNALTHSVCKHHCRQNSKDAAGICQASSETLGGIMYIIILIRTNDRFIDLNLSKSTQSAAGLLPVGVTECGNHDPTVYIYCTGVHVSSCPCPAMTFAVDWALNNNYLSILLSVECMLGLFMFP